MTFSRNNPSPRYLELVALYRQMHMQGDPALSLPPEKTFPGFSLAAHAGDIKTFIDYFGIKTALDYGCGKGLQYGPYPVNTSSGKQFNSIPEFWGVTVACYDPAYTPLSTLPEGKFDMVVTTDVLEHCPEDDLPWIVDEMFGYATRFLFGTVAIYPAVKNLPNGENAHTTIRPVAYWQALFDQASQKHGNLPWTLVVEDAVMRDGQKFRSHESIGTTLRPKHA